MSAGPQAAPKSAADMMQEAASANKCDCESFDQMKVITTTTMGDQDAGSKGICYGLSVAWLEHRRDGKESKSFLDDAKNWAISSAFARSHLIWINQNNTDAWQKLTQFKPATDKEGDQKEETFHLGIENDMRKLAGWVAGALGTRYFLVQVPGHTMAACGAKTGVIEFFDPNGGVVGSKSSSSLGDCLFQYFMNQRVKETYGVTLNVEKYKSDK